MLTVICKTCGKKTIWNDFEEQTFKCPQCGDPINIHKSLKENIERRANIETKKRHICPNCRGLIERKWFARCPSCGKWLIGKYAMSGRWFVIILIVIIYLSVSILYYIFGYQEDPSSRNALKEWLQLLQR